ncbi:MAG: ATP-binding protein [Candidatus Pacebacteria bacterium]|nr:ATP-binding protein [Candidatus Paceibacterota bacterium]
MKFYDREKEITTINKIVQTSKKKGQLIVLQGKRRVGKTALILYTFRKQPFLYFFVSKKTEKILNQLTLLSFRICKNSGT